MSSTTVNNTLDQEPIVEIGFIEATFNKNSEKLYMSFTPTLESKDKIELKCKTQECLEETIWEKKDELISKWFLEISKLEDSDITKYPIRYKTVKQNFFHGTNTIKSIKILVYKEIEKIV